ncbi:MAG: helix-turn-helix domain-containing protein [Rudaea sp.]|uniref:helix-turn-helix domain-containing protein n=1 Tax=Rudaea sp. TaxID=2136325 RepID=UPI0039E4B9D8
MQTFGNDNARLAPGAEAKQENSSSAKPTASTIIGQVLAEMRNGGTLTSRECWVRFGGSRLAAVVHKLRKEGWPIQAEEIAVECRSGRVAHVARYSLPTASQVSQ